MWSSYRKRVKGSFLGQLSYLQTLQREGKVRATVITPSPPVALAEHPSVEGILIGGKLYKHELVAVGAATVEAFRHIRADMCFLGIGSIHPEVGISTFDLEEAAVKRIMIAGA